MHTCNWYWNALTRFNAVDVILSLPINCLLRDTKKYPLFNFSVFFLFIWHWPNRSVPPADGQTLLWPKCQKLDQAPSWASHWKMLCRMPAFVIGNVICPNKNSSWGHYQVPCMPTAYGYWKNFECNFLMMKILRVGGLFIHPVAHSFSASLY